MKQLVLEDKFVIDDTKILIILSKNLYLEELILNNSLHILLKNNKPIIKEHYYWFFSRHWITSGSKDTSLLRYIKELPKEDSGLIFKGIHDSYTLWNNVDRFIDLDKLSHIKDTNEKKNKRKTRAFQ